MKVVDNLKITRTEGTHITVIPESKKDLIGKKNVNYMIIKQGEVGVIGYNADIDYYVAWMYKREGNTVRYFWGKYGDLEYAIKIFNEREGRK
jgi:hypothetical protein